MVPSLHGPGEQAYQQPVPVDDVLILAEELVGVRWLLCWRLDPLRHKALLAFTNKTNKLL